MIHLSVFSVRSVVKLLFAYIHSVLVCDLLKRYGAVASISNWKNFSEPVGIVNVTVFSITVGVSEGSGVQVIMSVLAFSR